MLPVTSAALWLSTPITRIRTFRTAVKLDHCAFSRKKTGFQIRSFQFNDPCRCLSTLCLVGKSGLSCCFKKIIVFRLWLILLRNFPVTTWWCFSLTPQNILKEWGRALKKVEGPIYYFSLDSAPIRYDCVKGVIATIATQDHHLSGRQSIRDLPPDQWLRFRIQQIFATQSHSSFLPEKSSKISTQIAQKDACNFFRFHWCCCLG